MAFAAMVPAANWRARRPKPARATVPSSSDRRSDASDETMTAGTSAVSSSFVIAVGSISSRSEAPSAAMAPSSRIF